MSLAENILYSKNEPLQQYKFTVQLTESDMKDFCELAYKNGVKPAEILAGFINDLVCGAYTRGSDERMFAEQYFDRCAYGMFAEQTFCRYVLSCDNLELLQIALIDIETLKRELEYYAENPDDPDGTAEWLQQMQDDIKERNEEIQEMYERYTKHTENPETLEQGLQGVQDYINLINEQMKGDNL